MIFEEINTAIKEQFETDADDSDYEEGSDESDSDSE